MGARPICAETGVSRTIAARSGLAACFCMSKSVSAGELGELEVYSLIVVSRLRRRDIKIPERDLLTMSGREIEQIRAHDRVVAHLLLVAILENQDRVWLTGHRRRSRRSGLRFGLWRGIGSGDSNLGVLLVVVVGRASLRTAAIENRRTTPVWILLLLFLRHCGRLFRNWAAVGVRINDRIIRNEVRVDVRPVATVVGRWPEGRLLDSARAAHWTETVWAKRCHAGRHATEIVMSAKTE